MLSVRSAQEASRQATGLERLETTYITWPVLHAPPATGNFQPAKNSPSTKTESSARRTTLRLSMGAPPPPTVLIYLFHHINFKRELFQFLDGCDAEGYHKNKAKRVRTTFTEEQLQVLQANFQLDSNPDGQDLERIAQITGLSKRVTQVWFQNSRARQKKHMHTGKVKTQRK